MRVEAPTAQGELTSETTPTKPGAGPSWQRSIRSQTSPGRPPRGAVSPGYAKSLDI